MTLPYHRGKQPPHSSPPQSLPIKHREKFPLDSKYSNWYHLKFKNRTLQPGTWQVCKYRKQYNRISAKLPPKPMISKVVSFATYTMAFNTYLSLWEILHLIHPRIIFALSMAVSDCCLLFILWPSHAARPLSSPISSKWKAQSLSFCNITYHLCISPSPQVGLFLSFSFFVNSTCAEKWG